jgi:hypothetical protein
MFDYHDEFNKLTPAQRIGRYVAIIHEMEFDIDLEWRRCSAESVLTEVTQTLHWDSLHEQLRAQNIGEAECLSGVQFWLSLRLDSEPWAEDLAGRCFEHFEGDIESLPTDQNHVDWWINAESEEDEELWDIRCYDPLFYGEICFELHRVLSRLVRNAKHILGN